MIEFTETPEQREARLSVRAFHFAKYKADAPAIAVPPLTSGPGAMGPTPDGLDVTPAPSSSCKRFELHGPRRRPTPRKCADCAAMVDPPRMRCPECSRTHALALRLVAQQKYRAGKRAEVVA